MDKEQVMASHNLARVLNRCHRAGLVGGVYDGKFCLWPNDAPSPQEHQDFFAAVEDESGGEILLGVLMRLDGGAGV